MSADVRRLDVLRAIVQDYVATQEPVGSHALLERHQLGVSSATIRNDMAVLEEEGYISQPYTSAGRIPTDKGYRTFVDRLAEVKALSGAERRAIETFLTGAVDLDDLVSRTVRLLAQVTNQVAIVQYPILQRSTVRHIELVELGASRLLVVLITSNGRVEQRVIETPNIPDADALNVLKHKLIGACLGERLPQAVDKASSIAEECEPQHLQFINDVVAVLRETVETDRADERIAVAGTGNLARLDGDFDSTIRPVLEAIEEQVVLLKLLGEVGEGQQTNVFIGTETGHAGLASTAIVTRSYGPESEALATLGTVGPTRMDYPATMATVGAVARYVGRILAED
mgnify:CR=1 FL=1